MGYRIAIISIVLGFVALCGALVLESGLFEDSRKSGNGCILLQQTAAEAPEKTDVPAAAKTQLQAVETVTFGANHAPAKTVYLGAEDPETEDHATGYRFQLELNTKGAAITRATFSNGLHNGKRSGFDDRHYKNPQPLAILSPVRGVLSMANGEFELVDHDRQIDLEKLHWKSFGVETEYDGQTARFEVVIMSSAGESVLKLIKTYRVYLGSYMLDCDLTVKNLTDAEQNVRFNLIGPVGIGREAVRGDMRKALAGFRNPEGQIIRAKLDIAKFDGKREFERKNLIPKNGGDFLWLAATNKYFAAILVPVPDEAEEYTDWVRDKKGRFYNPDAKKNSGDENIAVELSTASGTLEAEDRSESEKKYGFKLYLGPKDKKLFDKNDYYRKLGFVHTIDFRACCCPKKIIAPLAFGILALMEWMYGFIGNYGIVIIILVFVFRILIHPLTKKSQLSMSKMGKLAPRIEELKKKYANNKAELQKQTMALYKEQGASPIMGMLPMFAQMPIWIALWSAIYTGIALRGAQFDPWWITDLSAPDALFRFPAINLPLFGKLDSFNLLPLLMGVAFYLQQKMMPSQAAASTNPQMAQQQKMMKIMLPVLFPLMLYKGPSGVNLYIMSSVFAGVVEQYVIRKHIREKEQAESKGLVAATSKTGAKRKKKKPKPFFKTH